jgi:prepilin peptidase CpaA
MLQAALIPFALVLVVAAALDVRTQKIPNVLVLAALPLALYAAFAQGGPGALPGALLGGVALLFSGFALFALGAFGGGDAKLMAVAAVGIGLPDLLPFVLATAALGGLLAIGQVLWQRAGIEAYVMTMDLAKSGISGGRKGHRARLGDEGRITAPYGVAIAGGALLTLFTSYPEWLLG